MVDAVKSIAARSGTLCYADPFLPTTTTQATVDKGVLPLAKGRLAGLGRRTAGHLALDRSFIRRDQPMQEYGWLKQE